MGTHKQGHTSSAISTAIDEIKQAGLWPWKGSGIE